MTNEIPFPTNFPMLETIESIGENILLADESFNVIWMNRHAHRLLTSIAHVYGMKDATEMIGFNMNRFHAKPAHQENVMDSLTRPHRSRITIGGQIVTDIVITPVKDDTKQMGYVIMLMDVTTKADEEERREKLIQILSTPILRVWHNAIALPLIGEFDVARFDRVIYKVLEECTTYQLDYVLINVGQIYSGSEGVTHHMQKMIDCITLIGSTCIVVGVPAKLAQEMASLDRDVLIFSTTYKGLQYVIEQNEDQLLN